MDNPVIEGIYLDGHYVLVEGQGQRDRLCTLGFFGRDVNDIKRKQESKRGPEDKLILDSVSMVEGEEKVILSIYEAFFLQYALGCLDIKSIQGSSMDINTCWNKFRQYQQRTNSKIDFVIEFCVYYYFRTHGWIVKSGYNYGTNFLLYKNDPSTSHSLYAILVQPSDAGLEWKTILTHHRVVQSVNKELLLIQVKQISCNLEKPHCIENANLLIRKVSCKTNLMM